MTTPQALTLNQLAMEVSKNVKAANGTVARENVGNLVVYVPTLKDFGVDVEPTAIDAKDGTLTYAEQSHQWLWNSISAAVRANVRNKLKSGTTDLKPGAKLPENLVELVTPSENTGSVLAERRMLLDYFKAYLTALDRPENVKRLLTTFLEKPELLQVQAIEQRAKIKPYFENFGNEHGDRLTEWQESYLINVIEQCDGEEIEF